MTIKRITLIFIVVMLLFVVQNSFCAMPSKTFNLRHVVNVAAKYTIEFWDPETNTELNGSVTFTGDGSYVFATLVIAFNTKVSFSRIGVTFTDLVNTEDSSIYYAYTMDILKPDSTQVLVNTTAAQNGHGAGSATLYENKTFTKYSTEPWNTDEIADFRINLNGEDTAVIGSYQGNLTVSFTAK